ncbi:unnamed protein product [Pleuronectes platessa]|uniref:Uncharacterized protein n=1 Tax=Pleuronectes platessa TaxID=8262 RepID=A0A9N7YJ62_PLEPL|nr:unnamed protein product [Pleuronectes platessa]
MLGGSAEEEEDDEDDYPRLLRAALVLLGQPAQSVSEAFSGPQFHFLSLQRAPSLLNRREAPRLSVQDSVCRTQSAGLSVQVSLQVTLQDSVCRTHSAGLSVQDSVCRTQSAGLTLQDSVCRTQSAGLSVQVSVCRTQCAE